MERARARQDEARGQVAKGVPSDADRGEVGARGAGEVGSDDGMQEDRPNAVSESADPEGGGVVDPPEVSTNAPSEVSTGAPSEDVAIGYLARMKHGAETRQELLTMLKSAPNSALDSREEVRRMCLMAGMSENHAGTEVRSENMREVLDLTRLESLVWHQAGPRECWRVIHEAGPSLIIGPPGICLSGDNRSGV